jgi:hypothetical protein
MKPPVVMHGASARIRWSGRAAVGLALILSAAAMAPVRADDKADMERTKIIGNRELPKVLYIVPWKKPVPGELPGRPLKSLLDETMEPLDRDVFRRQVQYEAQVAPPAVNPAPERK